MGDIETDASAAAGDNNNLILKIIIDRVHGSSFKPVDGLTSIRITRIDHKRHEKRLMNWGIIIWEWIRLQAQSSGITIGHGLNLVWANSGVEGLQN